MGVLLGEGCGERRVGEGGRAGEELCGCYCWWCCEEKKEEKAEKAGGEEEGGVLRRC